MSVSEFETKKSVLTILKLDSKRLYERVVERRKEYMATFAVKRTREHFKDVFFSRYDSITFTDLKILSPELIGCLDNFYGFVEELKWYLMSTEDMPATVEDKTGRDIKELKNSYDTLVLYLEAELDVSSAKSQEVAS
ncbi:MAG: hypothetical protein CME70_21770 [Halobacteriovorax sp.]|nr:hypothetical protein [Halobacteriovorax sp.]|tara:strand:- start:25488 stop:25898 length:411 start_codon:yes stop_codon:yes gene_type:complete